MDFFVPPWQVGSFEKPRAFWESSELWTVKTDVTKTCVWNNVALFVTRDNDVSWNNNNNMDMISCRSFESRDLDNHHWIIVRDWEWVYEYKEPMAHTCQKE